MKPTPWECRARRREWPQPRGPFEAVERKRRDSREMARGFVALYAFGFAKNLVLKRVIQMSRRSYLCFCCALLMPAIGQAGEDASAAVAAAPSSPSSASALATSTEPSTDLLPLALAYLVPASVVTVGAFALSSPGYYVTGIAGAAGMIAAPPLVHGAYDNWSAAGDALLGTLASIAAGAAVGAGILIASGYSPEGADDGIGRVGGAGILGGLIGAGVGYAVWGTIDVIQNAKAPGRARSHGEQPAAFRATLPSLQPIFAAARRGAVGMAGVSIGLAGEF